jgi:hypothetical protein
MATMRQINLMPKLGCCATEEKKYVSAFYIATEVRPVWRGYPGTFFGD